MKNLILIILLSVLFSCKSDYSYVESLCKNEIEEILQKGVPEGNPQEMNKNSDWLEWNLENSPTKVTILQFDNKDKQDFKTTTYTFNKNGYILTCENFFKGNLTTIVNYKYNDLRYKTQEIKSSPHYQRKSIDRFKYDKNGLKIYDNSPWHNIYLYGKNKKIICELIYDTNGSFLRKRLFYHNEKNQNHLTIEYVDDLNNPDIKVERKFNEKGLPIEEKFYLNESYHGNPYAEFITYSYKYDSSGNWIEKIRISDKFGKTSEKRLIEY
ncbi:hypothetical protein [Marinifilum fragile]|uniref:hypothetical protein n=1 Tax=Marinifilum fragile TaxID=570161 RepID=UPI002AA8D81A|nr:hypothetical protein [Marinifilum fragile]